jgi:hypothetical protein
LCNGFYIGLETGVSHHEPQICIETIDIIIRSPWPWSWLEQGG